MVWWLKYNSATARSVVRPGTASLQTLLVIGRTERMQKELYFFACTEDRTRLSVA
jgi:hypothetical protein